MAPVTLSAGMSFASLLVASQVPAAQALDNGVGRVPIMGWSSWYGFTSNINEDLIKGVRGKCESGPALWVWRRGTRGVYVCG
jgi:hypothetical protein